MINKEKYIDFYNNQYTVFFAQQNDIDSRTMTLTPVNGSKIIPLDNSWAVSILYLKPDNTVCFNDGKLNDDGSITIVLTEQMLCVNGKCTAQLILYNPSDKQILSSASFNIIVNESLSTERIESSDEFKTLNRLILETKDASDTTKIYRDEASASATTASEAAQLSQQSATLAENAKDASYNYKEEASNYATRAFQAEDNASDYAERANNSAQQASASATTAQNYAVGDIDSARYYYEQTKGISEGIKGGLLPHGTLSFAELPDIANVGYGWMYDISDEFITTSNFKCGAGLTIPAGSNIYKTVDGYWDVLAGSPVTGIKGSAESSYRKGNVNITPENIGLGNVGNFKAVSTVASQGLTPTEKNNARNNIEALWNGGGTMTGTLEGENFNGDTTWWIDERGDAGGFNSLNATTLKESGTSLANKYASKSHTHTEYAHTSHTHDEATTSSNGFMSATDKVDLGNTKNQVNINTQFINENLCSPTTRNNIFRGEEIPSLAELVSRIHNNFENLYIGDHCKVQFSSDFLFQNCWDGTSKITADVTIAGFNTYIGTGFVTPSSSEQRESGHIYLMEPHAVMVLTLPIGNFKTSNGNAQVEPLLPLYAGTYTDTVWNNYKQNLGSYDPIFRILRGVDSNEIYTQMPQWVNTPSTLRESWLYRYVFNTYAYTSDTFDYIFPPTNWNGKYTAASINGGFESALQLYDMNDINYTDYVLEKPDYLPSYYNVFDASANAKIPTKTGAYVPFSSAHGNDNPVVIHLGKYSKNDNTGLSIDAVMSKFNLLSEEEIFGYNVYGNGLDNGHSRGILPLFNLAPGYRCFGGERYWLKNLAFVEPDSATNVYGAGVHQSVCTSVGMPDVDWWASTDAIRFYFLLAGGNKCTIKNQNPQSNYDGDKGGYTVETSEPVGGDSARYMRKLALAYGLDPIV